MSANPAVPSYLETLEKVIADVIAPNAMEIDEKGIFPRANIEALAKAGLLGLLSAKEVGGMGEAHRAATLVIERLAQECASTAMVLCMHYCGTAVIEGTNGPREIREAIAAGIHLTTLAFSEAGSRSHFWAPVSTAMRSNGHVQLDAKKSFATGAGEVDSYVWSSKPINADGASTIWLVPAKTSGLVIPAPFNGLGLRGNSTGIMESATTKSAAHVSNTKLQHLSQALQDLPTIRAYIARMRIKTDLSHALLLGALTALEGNQPNAMLRILEVKAAAGESATEVTDLAMRVCGGAAFRKEVGVERNFRDARAATVMAPTTDVLYDFIGKAVCGMPLFG